MRPPRRFATGLSALLSAALLAGGLTALDATLLPSAASATAVPPTPAGLTSAIEALQPYIGQSICDPVAKPGVSAFRDLLLRTYPDTTSLGIVRDCGIGEQSEHKEGRAFDWGVSVTNPTQVAEVSALTTWLTRTDGFGNAKAMARRLGIMYMIWNRQIWGAYDNQGWKPYSGVDPHTGHVHFSFGWNAAKKVTSYWSGHVAAIDYGPPTATTSIPHVTPVVSMANLTVRAAYGATTLSNPSSGAAVTALQTGLHITADGAFGAGTAAAVQQFQTDQHVTATGIFGPAEWRLLFPVPPVPVGRVDAIVATPSGAVLNGWALDADSSTSLTVHLTIDGVALDPVVASVPRTDVATAYPGLGTAHGYAVPVSLSEGDHRVCGTAVNAPGTPGTDGSLGCKVLTVQHSPVGAVEVAAPQLGTVALSGWDVDPDTTGAPPLTVTVDGSLRSVPLTTTTRTDIGSRFPGTGNAHGFTSSFALTQGSHAVCVTAANVAPTPGTTTALGCRTLVVRHDPVGAFETLTQSPAGVIAGGYDLDPDSTTALPVLLTVDGLSVAAGRADRARPDLTAYPLSGTGHGFSTTLAPLAAGSHTVCASAPNATGTPGVTVALGCRTLLVRHDPIGRLDLARTAPGVPGVGLAGWAFDPDSTTTTAVTVSVDGATFTTLDANLARSDVAAAYPGAALTTGYAGTLTLPMGPHTVCADALNADGTPGRTTHLGCRSVWVSTPVGTMDGIGLAAHVATVRGWTIDPDVAVANGVAVYVDGVIARSVAAVLPRADLARRLPGYGIDHAFSIPLTLTVGPHTICSTALNSRGTPGNNLPLGCRTLTVR